MRSTILRIVLRPFGTFDSIGFFYPNMLTHLLVGLFSVFVAIVAVFLTLTIMVNVPIIVFQGPEHIQIPEFITDPVCFFLAKCD